jgi:hypothetical protein
LGRWGNNGYIIGQQFSLGADRRGAFYGVVEVMIVLFHSCGLNFEHYVHGLFMLQAFSLHALLCVFY